MAFQFEALRDILVCPKSHAPLVFHDSALVSTDPQTRLSYSVVDGIPRLLAEEAVELSEEAWQAVMLADGRDRAGNQQAE